VGGGGGVCVFADVRALEERERHIDMSNRRSLICRTDSVLSRRTEKEQARKRQGKRERGERAHEKRKRAEESERERARKQISKQERERVYMFHRYTRKLNMHKY